MSTIRVGVKAFIYDMLPGGPTPRPPGPLRLRALENGLAMPSFWHTAEINEAFTYANQVWARADIEFSRPVIQRGSGCVPADDDNLWIHFVNQFRGSGVGVYFVNDLPSNEGGWGGGRIAVIAGAKSIGALRGYQGRILAHELGHVLLGDTHHHDPSNLMYDRRNPRQAYADLLDDTQIGKARRRAASL